MRWFLICVTIPMVMTFACVTCLDEYKSLVKSLFLDYNTNVRPVRNHTHAVNVTFEFYFVSLLDVDEVRQVITSSGLLVLSWTDQYLTWDPLSKDGLEYITVNANSVWRPDVFLVIYADKLVDFDTANMRVRVKYDGIVTWTPGSTFAIPCTMSTKNFPFDSHRCEYLFTTWSHESVEVLLIPLSDKINLAILQENNEWDITETTVTKTENSYSRKAYIFNTFSLKRKATYSIVVYVLPTMVASLVNLCVFKLPVESGEKASFSLTALLTFMLFFGIITSGMPQSSEKISILAILMLFLTMNSAIIAVLTVIVLRLAQRVDHENIPSLIKKLYAFKLKRCRNVKNNSDGDDAADSKPDTLKWGAVASGVDDLFFAIYSLVLIVTWLVFFLAAR